MMNNTKDLLNLSAEERNKLNEEAKSLAKIVETYIKAHLLFS